MFEFVVRYLAFLKDVPLLAWVMDALLLVWNFAFNHRIINAIERIEGQVVTWKEISTTVHRYGGLQFDYQGKEIGHVHSNGILDILFNTETKRVILAKGLAKDHHTFQGSGWITFHIRSEDDISQAIRLLEYAYRARSQKNKMISAD